MTVAAVCVVAALVGLSPSPVDAVYTATPTLAVHAENDDTTDESVVEEVPEGYVEVSTVPVVPNVEVEIDGNSGITDEEGKVLIEVEETRGVIERIDVKTRIVGLGGDWEATWQRNYRLGNRRYAMAFSRHMPVSFAFFGSNGEVIERDVIDSMTLKSSLGAVIENVPLDRPIILHGDRVVSTQRGPEVRDVEWSVESLIVRDTNVVNRSQVRFTPSTVDHVDVPLLFFSADFSVHDMFFLSPIEGQIELTLPNGDVELHDLDEDGRLHLDSMPRGEYKVLVLGSGPNIARPVVLSRNQTLDLEFLSWLDISVVGVSLVLFLTVPLIVGRRFLRRRSRRRARAYLEDTAKPPETDHDREVVESGGFEAVVAAATKTIDYSHGELPGAASTPKPLEGPLADLISTQNPANGRSPAGESADGANRSAIDTELAALVGHLDDAHDAVVADAHEAGTSIGDDEAGPPVGDEESTAEVFEPTAPAEADAGVGVDGDGFTIVSRDDSVDDEMADDPEQDRWNPPMVLRAANGHASPEWRRVTAGRTANGDDPEHVVDDDYSTDSVNR